MEKEETLQSTNHNLWNGESFKLLHYLIMGNGISIGFLLKLIFDRTLGNFVFGFFSSVVLLAAGFAFASAALLIQLYLSNLYIEIHGFSSTFFRHKEKILAELTEARQKHLESAEKLRMHEVKFYQDHLNKLLNKKNIEETFAEALENVRKVTENVNASNSKYEVDLAKIDSAINFAKSFKTIQMVALAGYFIVTVSAAINIVFIMAYEPIIEYMPKNLIPYSILK